MIEEKIVLGTKGEFPLNGKLTFPDNPDGPVPAAILVHGSGSTDMDEKISANKPFRDLAEGLAAHGIAVIRYDKRSYAHPRKLLKIPAFTVFDETIEDVLLAAAMLRADERVDAKNIFIIGHSMGGMLAPRIDVQGGDFAGLVIMAGTPRRLEAVLFEQLDEFIKNSSGLTRYLATRQKAGLVKKLTGIYEMDDEKTKTIKILGGTTAYYFKDLGEPDVPAFLAETKKPILVMQGVKDAQVRVDLDFDKYKELLAGRDNTFFKLYPELNHLFIKSAYGDLKNVKKDYKIPGKVAEYAMDDIAAFIKGEM